MSEKPSEDTELRPLDVDGVSVVVVGTVLWAVALVVLLAFHDRLADAGRTWWIWVGVAGVALGIIGVPYLRRFQRR